MTNPKQPLRDWHNTANPSQGDLSGGSESKGPRRHIPKEKLREWAMESREGGTAFCDWCGHYFAMYYIKRVKKSAFVTAFACADCTKKHNLQKVR